MTITVKPQRIGISANPQSAHISPGNPIARDYIERDPYTGSYTVTPAAEAQILETKNFRMTDNVTIAPIPNNYGLITWDGSTITVS